MPKELREFNGKISRKSGKGNRQSIDNIKTEYEINM
jgi:hypothetical protein